MLVGCGHPRGPYGFVLIRRIVGVDDVGAGVGRVGFDVFDVVARAVEIDACVGGDVQNRGVDVARAINFAQQRCQRHLVGMQRAAVDEIARCRVQRYSKGPHGSRDSQGLIVGQVEIGIVDVECAQIGYQISALEVRHAVCASGERFRRDDARFRILPNPVLSKD